MGLYDNTWPSTYEEIKRFYPVWYRDVLEMDAIWRVQGRELDGVRATVEGLIDNGYILTADLPTIISLEDFLRIVPEAGQTLEERRQIVAAYVRGREHIGAPEIRSIVGAFTAGTVGVGFSKGVISVKTSRKASEYLNLDSCLKILHDCIPAHLRLAFTDETNNPQKTALGFAGVAGRISVTRLPEWRLTHNFRKTTVGFAATAGRISTTNLPQWHMEYTFRAAAVGFTAVAGQISITRLPEWRMPHNFQAEVKTAGGLGVISTVTLPPAE